MSSSYLEVETVIAPENRALRKRARPDGEAKRCFPPALSMVSSSAGD
jgi:hypothetical protein